MPHHTVLVAGHFDRVPETGRAFPVFPPAAGAQVPSCTRSSPRSSSRSALAPPPRPRPTSTLAGSSTAATDDTAWCGVETPHDWSSEDLPTRESDTSTPVLAVRAGSWSFFPGDGNVSFAAPSYDNSDWKTVTVPADWKTYGYDAKNATAWYRRKFTATAVDIAAAKAGELRLSLGTVSEADVTYVNGVKVGSTGTMGGADSGSKYPKAAENSCDKALSFRAYGSAVGHHLDGRKGETGALATALKLGGEHHRGPGLRRLWR